MNKQRALELIEALKLEVEKEDFDENIDGAIFQIYAEATSFIGHEIKRIAEVEGSVTSEHPEIAPLYKFFHVILEPMKKYSKIVRERVDE